jgi:hypothetical protein
MLRSVARARSGGPNGRNRPFSVTAIIAAPRPGRLEEKAGETSAFQQNGRGAPVVLAPRTG